MSGSFATQPAASVDGLAMPEHADLGPAHADKNAPADRASDSLSKRRLKAWIRLLGATRYSEAHLRDYLRVEHGTTLPRFDVMAALFRRNSAVPMGELSRMLLISNGNATDVVTRLEADGLVQRSPSAEDRRTVLVALTPAGRAAFERIAAGHEREVNQLFDQLGGAELDTLGAALRKLSPGRDKT